MPYDPGRDPLVKRVRRRSRTVNPLLVALVLGLLGWTLYSDVIRPRQTARETESVVPHLAESDPARQGQGGGPVLIDARVKHAYTVGEKGGFGVSTVLTGKGTPGLEGSTGLRIAVDCDYNLAIVSTGDDGAATLQFSFGDASVYGNRFGYPLHVVRQNGVTRDFSPHAAPAITAANKDYTGPDLTAFNDTVSVRIDPDGRVRHRPEAGPVTETIGALLRLSGTAFPDAELRAGMTWERHVQFTLPGMRQPVAAMVTSTLTGTESLYGVSCLRIDNIITPAKLGKGAPIPALANLAHVDIIGSGTTWYDPASRSTLYARSSIDFNLVLSGGLQAAANALGAYSGLLEELEGRDAFDDAEWIRNAGDEPIGFHVQTVVCRKQ